MSQTESKTQWSASGLGQEQHRSGETARSREMGFSDSLPLSEEIFAQSEDHEEHPGFKNCLPSSSSPAYTSCQ